MLALLVGLVIVPAAAGTESTIYPGVGIGKVKLGMTEAQVKRQLGPWRFVNEREGNHLSVGWGFGEWTLDFVGGRVVQVATTLVAQKTATRVGVGTSWRALVRAYPHGVCTINNDTRNVYAAGAEYLVPHKGGTQTIYYVPQPRDFAENPTAVWRIREVHVRSPWVRLPEFGASWQVRCKDDWRTSDAPE